MTQIRIISMHDATSRLSFIPAPARHALPYFLLALVVGAVYGNSFNNQFLFDDDLLIKLNAYLRGWSHFGDIFRGSTTSGAYIAGGFYRPLQILLYLFAFQFGGGSTFLFHALNLILHIANAMLVHRLGIKLGFRPLGVFIATLIWALHPLHTEAVTYMSATADPLFSFFCLLSVVLLVPRIAPKKIFHTIPFFALALLSKETAVMLPLIVMSCIYLTSEKRYDVRTYLCTWPLWLITIIYTLWRMNADFLDGPKTFAHLYGLHSYANLKLYADHPVFRVYTFLATLPLYLKLLCWPAGLHMERSFSIYTAATAIPVLSGCLLIVAACGCLVATRKAPQKLLPLSWGILWFGGAHSPDTGLLVPMNALFLEHWMYLPSAGLLLGIFETAARFLEKRGNGLAASVSCATLLFVVVLSVKTYDQNELWRDPPSFYWNIFKYGEQSARARNNLGLYYADTNDFPDAIEQFQQAITISDSYAETRHNLALIYLREGYRRENVASAIMNLNRAIEIDPDFYRSYITLGDIYGIVLKDADWAALYHNRGEQLKKLRE